MAADDRHRRHGAGADSPPFFNEQAEEGARPVVPLGPEGEEATVVRPRRGGLSRNAALALAVFAAVAVGAAGGYLVHRQQAPEPAAEATAGAAPGQATTPPASGDTQDTSEPVAKGRSDQGKPRANAPAERAEVEESEGRGRDERGSAEGTKKEEERRREWEKKIEERRREGEKKLAERLREEEKRSAERRRDEEKGERPKARLVGTISGRP